MAIASRNHFMALCMAQGLPSRFENERMAAGFWGIVAALFLGPVTFVAAPFYAGFAWGDWFPLVLTYGGGIVATVLIGIGSAMNGE